MEGSIKDDNTEKLATETHKTKKNKTKAQHNMHNQRQTTQEEFEDTKGR